jgi:hypothetical protein
MAFPVSPTNGQTATVNNITYVYNSTHGSWTRTSSPLLSLYIVGNVNAGNVTANSGTVSTSTTTGALVVVGGVGVSGALYIANTGDVSANLGTATTNITTLFSNAAAQAASIDSVNSNVTAANSSINTFTTGVQAASIAYIMTLGF